MSKLYNFCRLIERYSVPFVLIERTDGHYDDGLWVEGEIKRTEMQGAVVPLPESKLYMAGGALSAADRQLILMQPLACLLKEAQIEAGGYRYDIEEETDYGDYADVAVYLLRRVSSFD